MRKDNENNVVCGDTNNATETELLAKVPAEPNTKERKTDSLSWHESFFDFLAKQFRFSIIFLLLISLIFLAVFPSFNKALHDTHWNMIQSLMGGLEVMLGFGIKYYFDERKAEQEKKTTEGS
jgi:hypothetical protein